MNRNTIYMLGLFTFTFGFIIIIIIIIICMNRMFEREKNTTNLHSSDAYSRFNFVHFMKGFWRWLHISNKIHIWMEIFVLVYKKKNWLNNSINGLKNHFNFTFFEEINSTLELIIEFNWSLCNRYQSIEIGLDCVHYWGYSSEISDWIVFF